MCNISRNGEKSGTVLKQFYDAFIYAKTKCSEFHLQSSLQSNNPQSNNVFEAHGSLLGMIKSSHKLDPVHGLVTRVFISGDPLKFWRQYLKKNLSTLKVLQILN